MSHTSPASYLVWAILSVLLGSFLVFHLWSFDRFKCLKWNNGPYSGAFKRVMTYSYLISVPLIMAYACGFAIVKYRQGFTFIPGYGIIPVPHQLWPESDQKVIFPFYLMFSFGWSLEMVTHLEELCFWLFLVNSGSAQQDWFRSLYFKTWVTGSTVAIVYLPLVTILTKSDPLKCEAYTFLAGSLGSLSLTLWFTPILWAFPSFLENLKREGVDINTIVRLTKFHELNTLRVCFRFLFTVPLVCLGIDGVRPHPHVNESMFWTDFLAMIAGFGCVISSGITLVIFFPRSIEGEIAARDATREKRLVTNSRIQQSIIQTQNSAVINTPQSGGEIYLLTSSPIKTPASLPEQTSPTKGATVWTKWDEERDREMHASTWEEERDTVPAMMPPLYTTQTPNYYASQKLNFTTKREDSRRIEEPIPVPLRPNRRRLDGGDVEMGGIGIPGLTEGNLTAHNQRLSKVNHLVYNFTSPIDLAYGPPQEAPSLTSRFGFASRR